MKHGNRMPSMRRRCGQPAPTWALIAFLLISLAGLMVAGAADYAINWWTADGGGGQSTGGVYAVTDTIGQPDAGRMSGGQFTLAGGFWGIVAAVPTPGAPLLSIIRTETNKVVVWWPAPAEGWLLQATTNLVTGGSVWTEILPPYATNATSLYCIEAVRAGNKFYRLHKP
jgi:hypothetical protein